MQMTTGRALLVPPALITKLVLKANRTGENATAVVVEDHAAAVGLVDDMALGLVTAGLDHTGVLLPTMALTTAVVTEDGAHGPTEVLSEA
jgi:hypothetical protein